MMQSATFLLRKECSAISTLVGKNDYIYEGFTYHLNRMNNNQKFDLVLVLETTYVKKHEIFL